MIGWPRTMEPTDPKHPDFSTDYGFAPCRREGCSRQSVHPAHAGRLTQNGRLPRTCPACIRKFIPSDLTPATLTCRFCGWVRLRVGYRTP